MKPVCCCLLFTATWACAQSTEPTLLAIGPHERVWQSVGPGVDAAGRPVARTNTWTELATGLNWWQALEGGMAQWEPTVEAFEISPKGYALAVRGPHKVILAGNINEGGSVDLELPDGQRLRSNPLALSFFDASTGQNVLLAEVKDCPGELIAPNILVFPDAFDGLKAALRYTYTRGGFEQDVILYEQPGDPALWGLNPDTVTLECYTEFYDPPEPEVEDESGARAAGAEPRVDPVLRFGAMEIGRGQAYFLGEELQGVRTRKVWQRLAEEGRQFLIEGVRYVEAAPLLERLQARAGGLRPGDPARIASSHAGLARRLQPRSRTTAWAAITRSERTLAPGLVLDYQILNSSQTNYVFKGTETYEVTGPVYLYQTTTLEAGTVIKFANTNSARLMLQGGVMGEGTPYRPVILTARDDDSVGQIVAGSTGVPSGAYASQALSVGYPGGPVVLENLRIKHAAYGLLLGQSYTHQVRHAQFVQCATPLYSSYSTLRLGNLLLDGVSVSGLDLRWGATATGQHLTLRNVAQVVNAANVLTLTNSLLTGVTNWTYAFNGAFNATNANPAAVFQVVGAGAHYLAPGSPYRNAGTAAIDPLLAQALRHRTTYPPEVLTGDLATSTTLAPQALRDADGSLDLGYHYDPLDYCWSGLTLGNNLTLVLTNGVAVGVYGAVGTTLGNGARFYCEGRPEQLNRLTRYTAVQEQSLLWGTANSALFDVNASTAPEVRLRFTDLTGVGCFATSTPLVSPFEARHCQFRGLNLSLYASTPGLSVTWLNNVVQQGTLYFFQEDLPGYEAFDLTFANNLFSKGSLSFNDLSGFGTWLVYDNLFDSDVLSGTGVVASYNGYRAGLTSLGGSGNQTGLGMDFRAGPAADLYGVLGGFYYPPSGGATSLTNLVNRGSRTAAAAGLYHFTTTTNQVKEASSQVDIGYHYVALDLNGLPVDTDGDGIPDGLEDRNGNGTHDPSTGETKWQQSENGTTGVPGLQVFPPWE